MTGQVMQQGGQVRVAEPAPNYTAFDLVKAPETCRYADTGLYARAITWASGGAIKTRWGYMYSSITVYADDKASAYLDANPKALTVAGAEDLIDRYMAEADD